jgi:hypothetical protein
MWSTKAGGRNRSLRFSDIVLRAEQLAQRVCWCRIVTLWKLRPWNTDNRSKRGMRAARALVCSHFTTAWRHALSSEGHALTSSRPSRVSRAAARRPPASSSAGGLPRYSTTHSSPSAGSVMRSGTFAALGPSGHRASACARARAIHALLDSRMAGMERLSNRVGTTTTRPPSRVTTRRARRARGLTRMLYSGTSIAAAPQRPRDRSQQVRPHPGYGPSRCGVSPRAWRSRLSWGQPRELWTQGKLPSPALRGPGTARCRSLLRPPRIRVRSW